MSSLARNHDPLDTEGDFDGHTNLLFSIILAIQSEIPSLMVMVRLSIFDTPPFVTSRASWSTDELRFAAGVRNRLCRSSKRSNATAFDRTRSATSKIVGTQRYRRQHFMRKPLLQSAFHGSRDLPVER